MDMSTALLCFSTRRKYGLERLIFKTSRQLILSILFVSNNILLTSQEKLFVVLIKPKSKTSCFAYLEQIKKIVKYVKRKCKLSFSKFAISFVFYIPTFPYPILADIINRLSFSAIFPLTRSDKLIYIPRTQRHSLGQIKTPSPAGTTRLLLFYLERKGRRKKASCLAGVFNRHKRERYK